MTTQAHSRPAAVQRWLNLATLGLVGEQRREVQGELEEHLLTRADHLHAFGTPYDQALTQALRELGSPLRVSAGIFKVYPMPKVFAVTALAALGLSGMLLAQAQTEPSRSHTLAAQQLTVPILSGASLCTTTRYQELNNLGGCSEAGLLALGTIRQLAQAAGMTVQVGDETVGTQVYRNALTLRADLREGTTATQIPARLRSDGELYYAPSEVLRVLAGIVLDSSFTPLPELGMQVSGLNVAFDVSTARQAQRLFDDLSFWLITALLPEVFEVTSACPDETCEFSSPSVASPATGQLTQRVQTNLPAGEVVMVVMPELGDGESYYVATAPVQEGGWAKLRLKQKPQQFVTDKTAILAEPGNLGHALLVRVTNTPLNDLASGIIQPVQRP